MLFRIWVFAALAVDPAHSYGWHFSNHWMENSDRLRSTEKGLRQICACIRFMQNAGASTAESKSRASSFAVAALLYHVPGRVK